MEKRKQKERNLNQIIESVLVVCFLLSHIQQNYPPPSFVFSFGIICKINKVWTHDNMIVSNVLVLIHFDKLFKWKKI